MNCAFLVTVSEGFLFPLNATMNALNEAGSTAAFEICYNNVNAEYIEKSKTAFNFPVIWTDAKEIIEKYPDKEHDFFSYKYFHALNVADKYDVICIIDADEFLYTNMDHLFEYCFDENLIITADNCRWNGHSDDWVFGNEAALSWSKIYWTMADFPLFFNMHSMKHMRILDDWINFYSAKRPDDAPCEYNQPIGAMSRSMCKHLKGWEDTHLLDGWVWIADLYISKNQIEEQNGKLFYTSGEHSGRQLYGIHNKFWMNKKSLREWNVTKKLFLEDLQRFDSFARNMETVKNFMVKFNDIKLGQYVKHYRRNEISRKQFIKEDENGKA